MREVLAGREADDAGMWSVEQLLDVRMTGRLAEMKVRWTDDDGNWEEEWKAVSSGNAILQAEAWRELEEMGVRKPGRRRGVQAEATADWRSTRQQAADTTGLRPGNPRIPAVLTTTRPRDEKEARTATDAQPQKGHAKIDPERPPLPQAR